MLGASGASDWEGIYDECIRGSIAPICSCCCDTSLSHSLAFARLDHVSRPEIVHRLFPNLLRLLVTLLVRDTSLLHSLREQFRERRAELRDLIGNVLGLTGEEFGSGLELSL